LAVLAAVPVVPWLVRSFVVTGNPVFPLLARWIPSRDFPAEMSRDFESYNRYMLWGDRWGYDLSIDARKLVLGVVALAVLSVGAVVIVRLRDPLHRIVAFVVIATVLAQIVAAGLYVRYWIPLLAVVQIPVIALIISRIDRRAVVGGLLAITSVLSLGKIHDGLRDEPGNLIAASVDNERRDAVLRQRVPLFPLYHTASEQAGPRSAVLMTYGCGGFYIDGPSMCTEFLQNSLRLSDWNGFLADLEELDITHVIAPTALGTGGPRPYDGNGAGSVGFLARDGTYAMVSRLLEERGELVATVNDQSVFRITSTDHSTS
jgi:hypothetical protein